MISSGKGDGSHLEHYQNLEKILNDVKNTKSCVNAS